MLTATMCPGQGGGISFIIKGVFEIIVGLVADVLPKKIKKYAAIIVIAIISYFTAGALTAELLAVAPAIGSLIAGEIAGEIVGKVITPANLMNVPLPKISPKSWTDLQTQLE